MLLSSPRSPSRKGLLLSPWNLFRPVYRRSLHRRVVPQGLDQELQRRRMHPSSSVIAFPLFPFHFCFLLWGSSLALAYTTYFSSILSLSLSLYTRPPSLLPASRLILFSLSPRRCFCPFALPFHICCLPLTPDCLLALFSIYPSLLRTGFDASLI